MGKEILDIIAAFSLWKGNTYTLASLIVEAQIAIDRQKLIDAGFAEAAEAI